MCTLCGSSQPFSGTPCSIFNDFNHRNAAGTWRRRREHFPVVAAAFVLGVQDLANSYFVVCEILQSNESAVFGHFIDNHLRGFAAIKFRRAAFWRCASALPLAPAASACRRPSTFFRHSGKCAGSPEIVSSPGRSSANSRASFSLIAKSVFRKPDCRGHHVRKFHRPVLVQDHFQPSDRAGHSHGLIPNHRSFFIQFSIWHECTYRVWLFRAQLRGNRKKLFFHRRAGSA